MRRKTWIIVVLLASPHVCAADDDDLWHYQTYIDAGYAASNRSPSNDDWRSKGTTAVLNKPQLFLGMANVSKYAVPDSRWGMQVGLQIGDDAENLVPSAPPPADEPAGNADTLRHAYRANVSYLFGDDQSVRLTGGIFNSHIGYESYLAIDNPNYTRGYILDNVPYFMSGLEAVWDVSESVDLAFYLVSGFNHLADPNDVPSTSFQVKWKVSPQTRFAQNIYYGSDQANTNIEFWRFFSDTIIEWKNDRFLVAAAFDYGTEKQADLPGNPRYQWAAGAIWAGWQVNERVSLAFRPEFYSDDDGLITGARQFIQAYTTTVKYQLSPQHQRLVGTLEFRYDRSTGDEGGFYDSPNDRLVPDQTLVLVGLLWSFEP